jgi:hypothetical protein
VNEESKTYHYDGFNFTLQGHADNPIAVGSTLTMRATKYDDRDAGYVIYNIPGYKPSLEDEIDPLLQGPAYDVPGEWSSDWAKLKKGIASLSLRTLVYEGSGIPGDQAYEALTCCPGGENYWKLAVPLQTGALPILERDNPVFPAADGSGVLLSPFYHGDGHTVAIELESPFIEEKVVALTVTLSLDGLCGEPEAAIISGTILVAPRERCEIGDSVSVLLTCGGGTYHLDTDCASGEEIPVLIPPLPVTAVSREVNCTLSGEMLTFSRVTNTNQSQAAKTTVTDHQVRIVVGGDIKCVKTCNYHSGVCKLDEVLAGGGTGLAILDEHTFGLPNWQIGLIGLASTVGLIITIALIVYIIRSIAATGVSGMRIFSCCWRVRPRTNSRRMSEMEQGDPLLGPSKKSSTTNPWNTNYASKDSHHRRLKTNR